MFFLEDYHANLYFKFGLKAKIKIDGRDVLLINHYKKNEAFQSRQFYEINE